MASPATIDKPKPGSADIDAILRGAIDLHCHSGPSVMPRRLDHIEAIKEAAEVGIKAILFKDHYYSVTPVTELLKKHYGQYGVRLVSGLALNNTVGGINRYAVDHTIKLGGDIIWMPTFSAANHIAHHKHDKDFHAKFPSTKEAMLAPTPLKAVDDKGQLLEEVKFILDLIAERNLILSSGHLHISEIWPLFDEAKKRGVKRLLVNHPTFVVDATIADIKQLAGMGAYIEHSVCMFIEGSKFKCYEPNQLKELIEAGTLERTILGSDLGQVGNPTPVTGFRSVIQTCLDIGYTPDQIRQMISVNPSRLLEMPVEENNMAGNRSDVGVKSVQVTLDVLEAVAFADREMGVTELAVRLELTKGTIFRHLKTLVERGYLSQNQVTSRYRLGVKSHLLGLMATASIDLLSASEQAMNELREETGQTVVLSAIETKAVRVVSAVMGKSAIEIGVRAGSELQFHASAQGKIGLAFSRRPPIARLQRQALARFTDHTITSWEVLRREVERVRAQGWATAPEQAMLGVNALAAPILDETGDCIGSLAIVGSIQFVRREPTAAQIAAVKAAALRVSRNLGYQDTGRGRAVA